MPEGEGTRVASLFAEIGADNTSLKRGLIETKAGLKDAEAAAKSFQQKLQEQTRAVGFEFRNLRGDVDDWVGRLRAATPANAAYARSFAEITDGYNRGRMSAGEAKSALEALRAEMVQGQMSAADYASASVALGAAFAAIAAGGAIAIGSTTQLAARVETLAIVTATLGRNVGLAEPEIRRLERAIQDKGITTQASRQAVAQMIQAEIDLAHATDLARLAQDAAVISGENSSQAFEALVTVIATGNVLMARRRGLLVDFQSAYEREAKAVDKSTDALSEQEKVQARVNEVMRQGVNISGAYEAAMGTAGKQAASLARLQEEAGLAIGNAFLPAYRDSIQVATQALTAFNDLDTQQKENIGTAIGYTTAIAAANAATFSGIAIYLKAASALQTMAGAMKLASASALLLKVALPVTVIAGLGVALYQLNQRTKETRATIEGELVEALKTQAALTEDATAVTTAYLNKQKELQRTLREGSLSENLAVGGTPVSNFKELERAVFQASGSYDEYITNLQRAARAEGLQIDSSGNLIRVTATLGGQMTKLIEAEAALVSSNYDLQKSLGVLIETYTGLEDAELRRLDLMGLIDSGMRNLSAGTASQAEAMKQGFADLQLFMAGPLGAQFKSFGDQQLQLVARSRELKAAIAEIEAMPQTAQGVAALEDLRLELDEVNFAIQQNVAQHHEATRRIIFNLLLQRAELANLTEEQRIQFFNMANEIAHAWGLIDTATFTAVQNIDAAFRGLARGGTWEELRAQIFSVGDAASAISGDYHIRFIVTMEGVDPTDELGEKRARQKFLTTRQRAGITAPPRLPAQPPRRPFTAGSVLGSGAAGGRTAAETAAEREVPMIQKLLDTAGALSQIGDIAATALQRDVIEPMQERIDAINALVSPAHIDVTARHRTAELEKERAEATERVAKAQERILALQREQEKLRFLESQVRLLDLIKEHGLDSADILGGLKLGLGADMAEVIEATTRAMAELVRRAEQELGVASPSWKFANMSEDLVAGLRQGWVRNIDQVQRLFDQDTRALIPSIDVRPMVEIERGWLDDVMAELDVPDLQKTVDVDVVWRGDLEREWLARTEQLQLAAGSLPIPSAQPAPAATAQQAATGGVTYNVERMEIPVNLNIERIDDLLDIQRLSYDVARTIKLQLSR